MNQEKIGRFIAENRRAKRLTQEGLAEKLGITNKSVSKWENGNCMPDSSLIQPLCKILDISIDELFAGEKLNDPDKKEAIYEELLSCPIPFIIFCRELRPDELFLKKAISLYDRDCGVAYNEFLNALIRMSEAAVLLAKFPSKEDAVQYLMDETSLPYEECSKAYDFYIRPNQKR